MGQARGGNHTGRESGHFGLLEERGQFIALAAGAITTIDVLVDRNYACLALDAGHHRGHGAGGIRRLLIGIVGLAQGNIGQGLEAEYVLLTRLSAELAFQNPGRGNGRNTHAVSDEQDDVLCTMPVGSQVFRNLYRLLSVSVPFFRRLACRSGLSDIHHAGASECRQQAACKFFSFHCCSPKSVIQSYPP